MRVTRFLAAAALAGMAYCTTAPGAIAVDTDLGSTGGNHGPSNLQVFPQKVQQGGKLTVTVDGDNCRHGNAFVKSGAFPRTDLTGLKTEGAAYATPHVHRHAKPGTYSVTATCKGKSITGAPFTVTHGSGPSGGEGGSVGGVSSTQAALGAGLVAAAVGGGVYVLRRRADDETA